MPVNMTIEDIKHKLASAGLAVENESRLPNDTGTQLRLKNGLDSELFR